MFWTFLNGLAGCRLPSASKDKVKLSRCRKDMVLRKDIVSLPYPENIIEHLDLGKFNEVFISNPVPPSPHNTSSSSSCS